VQEELGLSPHFLEYQALVLRLVERSFLGTLAGSYPVQEEMIQDMVAKDLLSLWKYLTQFLLERAALHRYFLDE
jgi:hypothetical protein